MMMMTRVTSFMITDILRGTQSCHHDDVTYDVVTGTCRQEAQLTGVTDDPTSAAG